MSVLESVMNASSHAMFVMDKEGIVTNINHQAKERFGLYTQSKSSHPAGSLNKGDLVIIADTAIGTDDNKLTPEDLEIIGIKDNKIHSSDMIVAVGVYNQKNIDPIYKFVRGNDASASTLKLSTFYLGHQIDVIIDHKEATVIFEGQKYSLSYFLCIGQMVIVDAKTKKVKFWEEKGYSARKEGIGSLLRGRKYIAKSPDFQIDVVGYHFRDFFDGALFEKNLNEVLNAEVERYENQEYDINGYVLTASILPIKENEQITGALVKFRRIEDIKVTIAERNEAIRMAESTYRNAEVNSLRTENAFSRLFGDSTAMASVKKYAYKLSQLDCSILITGESGTGKSRLAKAINEAQIRKGPYVVVDCATVAPTLFESEMFGYEAGAFTGASSKGKAGFFEAADGGTIFLDEIGEIPLDIQVKLLNVIQNKTVCRVGSTKAIPVDVRIIAATNRDLKKGISEGWFRTDLYYRLSAFSLELPPLRNCQEDIFFIINNLMETIKEKYGMPEKYLSGEVFSKLIGYNWPGNIRELENVLERAVVLTDSDIIYPEHILIDSEPLEMTLKQRLKLEESKIIKQALVEYNGNKPQVMKKLGISKTVFYEKIKEYGII